MSRERDELAKAIFIADNHKAPEVAADEFDERGPNTDYTFAIASALLAAGYRKPRVVTTAEELDALPTGSVVRDEAGDVAVRAWAEKNGWRCWSEIDYMDHCADALDAGWFLLPATVLHEGAQP